MKTPDRHVVVPSLFAALVAAWLGASASVARACPAPYVDARRTWPESGASVPKNARFVVSYVTDAVDPIEFGPGLVLVDAADGTTVPTTASTPSAFWQVVVRPSAPLKPNHAYQLADRRTVPCSPANGGCDAVTEPVPFASFTTTAAEDTTPPTFAGLQSIAWGREEACSINCCGNPYDAYDVRFTWPDATDDVASAVAYNVYRRDEATATSKLVAGFLPPGGWGGLAPVGHTPPPAWTLEYGTYSVRAVDWAGNEDTNESALKLSPDDAPKEPADGGSGCSVSGAPGPSALGPAALLLALAAIAAARARPACAASRARRG